MRQTRDIMGMPVSVEIVGGTEEALEKVFTYFDSIDARFSTYKSDSEISKINRGEIPKEQYSDEMKEVFRLSKETEEETAGFFSIEKSDGSIDPSGMVKGWAIQNAAHLIEEMGYTNYFLDVGGDIQASGVDENGNEWTVGIRNPFDRTQIVKVIRPGRHGVATSGTYIRGQHIYNPHEPKQELRDIVSMTVIGPNIYETDRFATAAFAMGRNGIMFIENLDGFDAYAIDSKGIATMTSQFKKYIA